MNRRVRLTERLALGCGQERIFSPITETSKLATVELDEFAKRIEAEPTVKGWGVPGGVYLDYAEIRGSVSELPEQKLD
jgi:hypothetical protein